MPTYMVTDQMVESGEAHTWIEGYDETLLNATTATKYGAALYFATTTLSTVGYGDILPLNEGERMYTAFFQAPSPLNSSLERRSILCCAVCVCVCVCVF